MKDSWKEIAKMMDIKFILIALVSFTIVLLLTLLVMYNYSCKELLKIQLESHIHPLFINPAQTNFTP